VPALNGVTDYRSRDFVPVKVADETQRGDGYGGGEASTNTEWVSVGRARSRSRGATHQG